MPAPPADQRPRPTFGLASLLLVTLAVGGEIVALRNAVDWGVAPAAAIALVTGAMLGLIELRRTRGFGTLRGRLFHAAIGGMGGGGVFALVAIGLEWYGLGEPPAPWSTLALRLGTWLLWGGLAGGVLGAVVDLVLAPRRRPLPPRSDPQAGEFLAALPADNGDMPAGGS